MSNNVKSIEELKQEESNKKYLEVEKKMDEAMKKKQLAINEEKEAKRFKRTFERVDEDLEADKLNTHDLYFWELTAKSSLPEVEEFRERQDDKEFVADLKFRMELIKKLKATRESIEKATERQKKADWERKIARREEEEKERRKIF